MPDWSRGVCIIHGGQCLLLMAVFFLSSDQILSITPTTKEQVDILKNVSTQYEVGDSPFIRDWVGVFFLSSCESLFEMFSPRQPYGSRPHLSSSKKRLRSTCLYLPTAQRPSQACCRNTPSLMSKMPAWQLRKLTAAKFRKRKNG